MQKVIYIIQSKSNSNNNDDGLVDREKMDKKISELGGFKIDMNEDTAFIFVSRNKTDEDNDPLMICMTSPFWLSWIRK